MNVTVSSPKAPTAAGGRGVWVYKKVNDKLILLNDNKPTYSSRLQASKELKISTKTIRKYLDTHKEYKGLYFYSASL